MVSPPSSIAALLKSKTVLDTPGIGGFVWEIWSSDRSLLDEIPRGVQGLVVDPVFQGRPLEKAGLQRFDVIVSCDGEPVRRRHELLRKIRSKPAGSSFTLEVLRPGNNGKKSTKLVTDSLAGIWK
jgi:S1-C subfamily serine protease